MNAAGISAAALPTFGPDVVDCSSPATEDPGGTAVTAVVVVAARLPRRYGSRHGEIQVLAPLHRGDAGVGALNTLLQGRLNPPEGGAPEARGGA